MAIYVDEVATVEPRSGQARRHGRRWAHLMTDGDLDELHEFAEGIGLKREWFQNHRRYPHYDVTANKRYAAIRAGAVPVTRREILRFARRE